MYCRHCGKQHPDHASFCPFCGKPGSTQDAPATQAAGETGENTTDNSLSEPPAETPLQAAQPPLMVSRRPSSDTETAPSMNTDAREHNSAPKKKKPIWLWLAIGGAVLAAAVILIIWFSNPGAKTPGGLSDANNGLPPVNSSDFNWPVPQAGEKLFIGTAEFSEAQRFYVAFILTADGENIYDLTLRAEELTLTIYQGNNITKLEGSTVTDKYDASFQMSPGGKTDLGFGMSSITGLTFRGNTASCRLHYVYTHRSIGTFSTETYVDLGSSDVTLLYYPVSGTRQAADPIPGQTPSYAGAEEFFLALSVITDPGEFDAVYNRGVSYIRTAGFFDDWDLLCRGASAYLDFKESAPLRSAMEDFAFERPDFVKYTSLAGIRSVLDSGITSLLLEKIYIPGNHLDLPAALWMQSALSQYISDSLPLDPQDPRVQAIFQAEFNTDIEMLYALYTAMGIEGSFEDHVCGTLGITRSQLQGALSSNTASGIIPAPSDPQPLTALLVDLSATIGIDDSEEGFYPVCEASAAELTARARHVYDALTQLSQGRLRFTGNPELADVIVTMNVSYPHGGTYSAGTDTANVYGCAVEVRAYRAGSPVCSFIAENLPGSTINGSGSIIWMMFPSLADNADARTFTEQIVSWYQ